jgi:hypothetical protein
MYVLCAGMYRACSTWQYEVIAHLLERHRAGRRLGYLTGEEFAARDARDDGRGAWQVLKSHEGHPRFARAIAEGRACVIYAHRDVRDVAFSLMHKRGLSFEDLTRRGMIHQVLVNDRFWSSQPRGLSQRYDDLVADPASGVCQIADHLGITLSRDEAEAIAAEYSFQNNRRRTIELGNRLRAEGVDLGDPANRQYYDQRTLLHWNHLREGRPGNWRDVASPRQRSVLSKVCDRWLASRGYEVDTFDASTTSLPRLDALRRERDRIYGWLACTLRGASVRYPLAARVFKAALGIATSAPAARPVRPPVRTRPAVAWAPHNARPNAVPKPHFARNRSPRTEAAFEAS